MMLPKTNIQTLVLRLVTVGIVSVVTASCGGSSGSNAAGEFLFDSANGSQQALAILQADELLGERVGGSWTLGDNVFNSTYDGLTSQDNRTDSVTISASNGFLGASNDSYAIGYLNIELSSNGSGNYVITDASSASSMFNSGANVASIEVFASDVVGNGQLWASTETSGTLVVSVNAAGRYFVSTSEPIVVTKEFDLNAETAELPDQILLEINNVNANPDAD